MSGLRVIYHLAHADFYERTRLTWLCTILLGSILTGIPMALLNPIIITQVHAGSPFARPIFGYSSSVFLTIVIVFFGVWAWARWQNNESILPKRNTK